MQKYLKCDQTKVGKKFGCLNSGTPYDCNSITHAKRYISSELEEGLPITHEVIKPTKNETERLVSCVYGQKSQMSAIDIMDLNIVYGCSKYLNVKNNERP